MGRKAEKGREERREGGKEGPREEGEDTGRGEKASADSANLVKSEQ